MGEEPTERGVAQFLWVNPPSCPFLMCPLEIGTTRLKSGCRREKGCHATGFTSSVGSRRLRVCVCDSVCSCHLSLHRASSTHPFVYSDGRTETSCSYLSVFGTLFKYLVVMLARLVLQLLDAEQEGAHHHPRPPPPPHISPLLCSVRCQCVS